MAALGGLVDRPWDLWGRRTRRSLRLLSCWPCAARQPVQRLPRPAAPASSAALRPRRPAGDSQALPGYISIYLQISDPGNNNSKWDCFASYRLSVRNLVDDSKSVHRDSWHRFSAKKKSHGVWGQLVEDGGGVGDGGGEGGGRKQQAQRARRGGRIGPEHRCAPLPRTGGSRPARALHALHATRALRQRALLLQATLAAAPGEGPGASQRLRTRGDARSTRTLTPARPPARRRPRAGWCDFAALSLVLDPKQGFLGPGDTIQISTDITILHESVTFTRESDLSGAAPSATGDVYSGKFVWRVHNFSAFQPLLKTQKIMSPGFPAGEGERGGGRGSASVWGWGWSGGVGGGDGGD